MANNEPLRILHIIGAMNRGGAETLLMEIYRHINRSKVQFDFLVYNYSNEPGAYDDEIRSLGGRIYEAKRRFYRGPISFYKELIKFFSVHSEYRIVHAHQFLMSGYMLKAAKGIDSSIVTVAHSHIANTFMGNKSGIANKLRTIADRVGHRILLSNADYTIGCAEDALIEMTGNKSNNITRFVMRNAIDPSKFSYNQTIRMQWRKYFNANEDTLIVGNVARFTYQKNHELIINTFANICGEKENSILVLVGVGDREVEMRKLATELGIIDKVFFMGSRGDVNEIVNAFDVFLMPSRYEGLGIVLIEAQANGLQCIISKDVIPDEADVGAGLVTRVSLDSSVEEWAQACISAGTRIDAGIAQQAVKDAGYDITVVADWLEKFYLDHWN